MRGQHTVRRIRAAIALATLATVLAIPQAAFAGQGFRDDDGNIHERAIEAVSNAV